MGMSNDTNRLMIKRGEIAGNPVGDADGEATVAVVMPASAATTMGRMT